VTDSIHTPGPWEKVLVDGPTSEPAGLVVRTVHGKGIVWWDTPCLDPVDYANAQLIAAAPDLLKACQHATSLYDHLALGTLEAAVKYGPDYEPPTDEDCLRTRGLLGDAIAKATDDAPAHAPDVATEDSPSDGSQE